MGRDQEVARLRRLISDVPVVVRQVVHGLAGVGKSELVRQYAQTFRWEYPVAWWITADSPQNLELGLAALAAALHPPVGLIGDAAMAADWALDWLQGHPGWLVVLDNVEDPAHIRASLGRLSGGHLVITTRRDVIWPGLTPLALHVLDKQPALALLQSIIGLSPTSGADQTGVLAEIARELGFLPLALEQAAAYMRQQRCSPERYLREIGRDPGWAHARYPQGGDAERIIARLWSYHLTALCEHDQRSGTQCEDLLRVLACMAPDDIPRALITHTTGQEQTPPQQSSDQTRWEEELAVLASYSMITRSGVDEAETISLHRLFQSVIRYGLNHDDPRQVLARRAALSALLRVIPPDPRSNMSGWPLWRHLLPHIDAMASCHHQGDEPADLAILLNHTKIFLSTQGQYQRAHDLAVWSLAIAEAAFGPDHPAVAIHLTNLAVNNCELGRAAEALPLIERALAIAEAAHGLDHPTVATYLGSLAACLRDLGRSSEAIPLEQRALAIVESESSPDQKSVAILLGNLAHSLNDLGRAAEALPLFERALAIAEAVYGLDHPIVATHLGSLAASLRESGRAADAIPLEQRALAVTEAAYGPDHPAVATRLSHLAGSFRTLGRPSEADPLFERALAIAEAAHGPHHPLVATHLGNVAGSLRDLGRAAEAIPLERRALAITEAAYGLHHPAIAIKLGNLAGSLIDLGKADEAVPLLERALALTEAAYGSVHPTVAVLLGDLGGCFRDLGQHAQAIPIFERALATAECAHGPHHPQVTSHLRTLAVSLSDLGRFAQAIPLLERALRINETALGADHSRTKAVEFLLKVVRKKSVRANFGDQVSNLPCSCGSGKKNKRCHGGMQ
ncbi:tetratricopeptide repeat protein [Herbidospora sp. NBRC 101105]|uniref:tetratricopeptide repeat protein n=1 Tax=Herbidospora sp. NBRC 101105 TaxID=3032195 RepID=UPI0025551DFF|nr:tetratricopeptide repeat protein [Herbidospora sp. NBRC 101105]